MAGAERDGCGPSRPSEPQEAARRRRASASPRRTAGLALALAVSLALALSLGWSGPGCAQSVEDGSDAGLAPADARRILDLVGRHLKSPDAKVSSLRASAGRTICGAVDVKNRDGLYTGPRGFVVDLASDAFDRVPDGPELLSARRGAAYDALERQRQRYFGLCLD